MTETEKKLIEKFKDSDVSDIALKLKDTQDVDKNFVLRQIAGSQTVRKKMPLWSENPEIIFPAHLPLEQCSSFLTASYKKEVAEKILQNFDSMADLTGGFGIDFFVLSENFNSALYIERNTELFETVKHNFKIFNRGNAAFLNADGVEFLKETKQKFNLLFIDPARRNSEGKKTVKIQDCEPNIIDFQNIILGKADFAMIKLSPMLDISDCIKKLKNIREIHIAALENECKEVLIILQKGCSNEPEIFTANDSDRFSFFLSQEQNTEAKFFESGSFEHKFLFEPDAAVMKAGAFKILTQKFPVRKLHPSSHLYISESEICGFPGRMFLIKKAANVKDFTGYKANLSVRNFPQKAEELKKKLKIKDGGNVFLFATTLLSGKKVIIEAEKITRNAETKSARLKSVC